MQFSSVVIGSGIVNVLYEKNLSLFSLGIGSIVVAFVLINSAIGATLPAAPGSLIQAPNCADVRSGSITWNTSRDALMAQAVAKQSAIDETLMELVRHLAGTDIRSLTRTDLHIENDALTDQLQVANFAKIKGRILDYNIISIQQGSEKKLNLFKIELSGRVCADNLVDEPMIVALKNSHNIPHDLLNVIESELSRNFAAYPKIVLADKGASKTYNDIEINVDVDPPRSSIVDRSDAIAALKSSLGENAVQGISQYATRVELRMTMSANIHEDGSKLVATHLVERELPGKQQPSRAIIAEMKSEATKKVAKNLSIQLAKHIKKLGM